eukprot:461381-Pleurochrysis_carterae.AAC.2
MGTESHCTSSFVSATRHGLAAFQSGVAHAVLRACTLSERPTQPQQVRWVGIQTLQCMRPCPLAVYAAFTEQQRACGIAMKTYGIAGRNRD